MFTTLYDALLTSHIVSERSK